MLIISIFYSAQNSLCYNLEKIFIFIACILVFEEYLWPELLSRRLPRIMINAPRSSVPINISQLVSVAQDDSTYFSNVMVIDNHINIHFTLIYVRHKIAATEIERCAGKGKPI